MADYSQSYFKREDASHGNDFFKYGHVGTFDVYQQNSYEYNDLTGRFVHNGWEDTLVTYAPSPTTPSWRPSTTSTSTSLKASLTTPSWTAHTRAC